MTDHPELLELVPLYAFGALEGEERTRLEAHLAAGCPACEAELRDADAVAEALADAVEPVAPSAEARARLLARVRADAGRATPRRRAGAAPWLLVAASVAAAAVLGLRAARLASLLDEERGERAALQASLERAEAESERDRAERAGAEERVARLREGIRLLGAPDTRAVALVGQGAEAGASARAFLNPAERRILLFVSGLPPTPAGQTYQLWVILEGKPISAGVFDVDAEGSASQPAFTLPELTGPATVAVTVEPAGGVPQPTGPVVLAGS